jgi:hypothetical protein
MLKLFILVQHLTEPAGWNVPSLRMLQFRQNQRETHTDTQKKTTGHCGFQGWCNYNIYTGQFLCMSRTIILYAPSALQVARREIVETDYPPRAKTRVGKRAIVEKIRTNNNTLSRYTSKCFFFKQNKQLFLKCNTCSHNNKLEFKN